MGTLYRVCALAGLFIILSTQNSAGFELSVFDMGQGEALLVNFEGECLWIDFGTKSAAGLRAHLFLKEKSRCTESVYVISHQDWDHRGGVYALADVMDMHVHTSHSFLSSLTGKQDLVIPVSPSVIPAKAGIHSYYAGRVDPRRSLPSTPIGGGDDRGTNRQGAFVQTRLPDNMKTRIEWLWPPPNEGELEPPKDKNDGSLVLRVWDATWRHCAMLTGDITRRVEKILLRSGDLIPCEILKVAHHGSKTSTSAEFLRAMAPRVAVISNGWENGYGHPHKTVLERLNHQEIWTFRTDWMGRVRISLRGDWAHVFTPRGQVTIALHTRGINDMLLR